MGTVWSVPLLDWIRTCGSGHTAGVLGPLWFPWALFVAGSVALMSLTTLLLFVLTRHLRICVVVALPLAWVLGEEVRAAAAQHLLGTSSDFMRLAITQVDFPLFLQVADVGGAILVGWIVVSISGLLAVAIERKQGQSIRTISPLLAGIQVVVAAVYGVCSLQVVPRSGPTVAILPTMVLHSLDSIESELGAFPDADYVVFPEGAVDGVYPLDKEVMETLSRVRLQFPASNVIAGVQRLDPDTAQRFNSVLLVADAGSQPAGRSQSADKRFLTPGFEFTPVVARLCGVRFGASDILSPGDGPQHLKMADGVVIGVGICHDVAFSSWGTDLLADQDVDFFVTVGNEGLDSTGFGQDMLLGCAALRAVECRRSIVRSVAFGHSVVVDSNGVETVASGIEGQSAVITRIPIDTRTSMFARYGGLLPWGLIFVNSLTAGVESRLTRLPESLK
jgi:apolipoprotein N-acyltransferase